MNASLSALQVRRARTLLAAPLAPDAEVLGLVRLAGRVVEVSEPAAQGALSAVCPLMAQVQARGEQIAWIEPGASVFFPPDLTFRGLDARAVSVVWVPDRDAGLQAADWLLRSQAFGLVIVDWASHPVDDAVLGRLGRLAGGSQAVLLFLTRKAASAPSLGSLVSLRVAVSSLGPGETELLVLKDKRPGPPLRQRISFHGPFGMY
jgi:hypothetical protein